jgi:hypothetical protein
MIESSPAAKAPGVENPGDPKVAASQFFQDYTIRIAKYAIIRS